MKRIMLLALCAALAACGESDHGDLRQWMEENSRGLRGKIPPLPEVKPYVAVPYEVSALLDPFQSGKIVPAGKNRRGDGQAGALQPDFEARERRKNPLENYPLESLSMIGRMVINNQTMAVIKYEDKVKQVRVGDYIGLDFGMVTKITDNEVQVKELIQDSAGDWSERDSSLYLQTKEGSSK